MNRHVEDSTPVLVGAGQYTEKDVHPLQAHSPMGIAAEAAKAALEDTGVGHLLPSLVDTVAVVRLFSDSLNRPRLMHSFGRAENPPRALARRIGADPANAIYGNLGGNTPQKLLNEMAERIVRSDVGVVLLAGAEAIKTTQAAIQQNLELDWNEKDAGNLEDRGLGEALTTNHEYEHGVGVPIQTYPLFENALRGKRGASIEQHLLTMGNLFQPFTETAETNPYAFYGTRRTAKELATVTSDNRYICFPYPKLMNARDAVNQGAALIMTSVGKARELDIDPARWIYLHGCGEANDPLMSERDNYYSSPAIRINVGKALEMAGKTIPEMTFFDLYSCFPSAVEIACDELGIAYDDPRGLTVTGGLPYFGGPGNNYSMHGIASMVERLRANHGEFGMVTANGGWLSKHATGIYSGTPTLGLWGRENPSSYQQQIDGVAAAPAFTEEPAGDAIIETYTVCFGRNGPERGIVIGRLLAGGERFIANTPEDASVLNSLVAQEGLGRRGVVRSAGGRNIFTPG